MSIKERQLKIEIDRFLLLRQRDGQRVALSWLRSRRQAYQEAVSNPGHFAASREYRRVFKAAIAAQGAILEHAARDDWILISPAKKALQFDNSMAMNASGEQRR